MMARGSDDHEKVELVTESGDASAKVNTETTFVLIIKRILNESSSSITWIHRPKSLPIKLVSQAKIDLIITRPSSGFISPDLRKLCEEFQNL